MPLRSPPDYRNTATSRAMGNPGQRAEGDVAGAAS
ncbi:MAG: hypothetical protein K0R11_1224, partial [Acidimicrobiales bacterium]|nr:hypothetical protein [Acidimicrobiales bacterium]